MLFADLLEAILALLREGCSKISADFSSKLASIPIKSFQRTLESAYSYMEIIVAGVNNQETKEECLKCLIQDWKQFIVTSLMENEYNEINQILNQSIISVLLMFSFDVGRSRDASAHIHAVVQ